MPALVKRVEWSSARGTREADGTRKWPFSSKNARNASRNSGVVRITRFYERFADLVFHLAERQRAAVLVVVQLTRRQEAPAMRVNPSAHVAAETR